MRTVAPHGSSGEQDEIKSMEGMSHDQVRMPTKDISTRPQLRVVGAGLPVASQTSGPANFCQHTVLSWENAAAGEI